MDSNNQNSIRAVKEQKPGQSIFINRLAYGAFVLLAVYFLVFSDDKMYGIMQLGIALIFDPFDQTVPFQKRPLYQRGWLLFHLLFMIAGFVYIAFI